MLSAAAVITAAMATWAAPAAAAKGGHRAKIDQIIRGMSLEEKVGQLFVMRCYGASATDPAPEDVAANQNEIGISSAAELIAKYHVGGIIYFAWAHNVQNPHQIADLSNGIQQAALSEPSQIPLLISTDQEHGLVCRVGSPATLFPGSMALGAGGRTKDAKQAGIIAGRELAAMGINQNYAPDADVNVNPANPVIAIRSFGAEAGAVAEMVAAQVDGYQRGGVSSTAKHFPGHGDTATDSHFGLPLINHSIDQWEAIDAPPFQAAVKNRIDSIMTAHIMVPALDPSGDPATLSKPILTGILREKLGYDGVVITDSLGMEGVREKYGDDRVPVLALQAGVDQLLNPPNLDVSWNAVVEAVKSGELTEERLDVSLRRILELKMRRGLFDHRFVSHEGVDRIVGAAAHLSAAEQITQRTMTLVRNEGGMLPLSPDQRTVLVVGANPAAPSGTGGPPTTVLAKTLTDLGHPADSLNTGTAPSQTVINNAVAAAGTHDVVVVTTSNVSATSAQRRLVDALVATGKPIVHIAVNNPYDIARFPTVRASLATYSWIDVTMRAVARVITGDAQPTGRLPVSVPREDDPASSLYPIGHGLTY